MTGPIVILRPEPGCTETFAAAWKRGLTALRTPLFAIEPVMWTAPDPAGFDALLVGSANVFRQAGEQLSTFTRVPVIAVGERTAEAARNAGFAIDRVGRGGLQGVVDEIGGPARLLRLAGEARVHLNPPVGVSVVDRIVYRSAPLALATEAADALAIGGVVLLHSVEAAKHFAAECDRLSLSRSGISIAALAPRIVEAAGNGWRTVRVAAETTDAALLALADDMCH